MSRPDRRVLVAGIGNLLLSDDGFGVAVANRLAAGEVPAGGHVADFGIRGVHLAYELLDGYEALVLVDAVSLGEAPGTVALIEPESVGALSSSDGGSAFDPHGMSPEVVLATLERLGGRVDRVYVVGCQPACLDEGIGLSPPVAAAVEGAVELCQRLLTYILPPAGKGTSK